LNFVADTVDFVFSVYGAEPKWPTFNKINRVEFNFVASVYRASHMLQSLNTTCTS